jgi:hypothetical protein
MTTETLSPIQKELLDRADNIFKVIADTAAKAGNFAMEHLPDIANQYIAMERFYLTSIFILSILTLIALLCIHYKIWMTEFSISMDGALFSLVISLPFFALSIIGICSNFRDLVMVWFAPKIYLITHIIQLIKT